MIHHSTKLVMCPSPVVVFCAQANTELLFKGHTDSLLDPDHEVIWSESEIMGVEGCMIFYTTEENYFWRFLTYVKPAYRRQGVMQNMWARLLEIAKEREVKKICSVSEMSNPEIFKANEKIGLKPRWTIFEMDLGLDSPSGGRNHHQWSYHQTRRQVQESWRNLFGKQATIEEVK